MRLEGRNRREKVRQKRYKGEKNLRKKRDTMRLEE